MRVIDALKEVKKSASYEIVTLWREMLLKSKGRVVFVDLKEYMIGFDLNNCRFKELFTDKDVHVKLSQERYLKGSVIKLDGGVLHTLIKDVENPPPFVFRKFLRVVPPPEEKVTASMHIKGGECILDAPVLDISEGGLAVVLDREKDGLLLESFTESEKPKVFIYVKLPLEGIVGLNAEIRNVNAEDQKIRVGMRFLVSSESEIEQIRKFIIRTQKKLLEVFSSGD